MEELRNLKQIYSLAAGRFNQYEGKDFVLPRIFKEQVTEINSNTITYNDYSAVIETRGNQNGVLNIYLPNQWFYIASYFTDFYNELQRYKKEALKVVSKERLKDLNGSSLTEQEESRLQRLSLTDQSKSYLRRFMTDYSWWFGAKTIDRGDFYVSPILSSARLVNASQSFVADLCAFLANKTDLVQAIISGEEAASKNNNSSNSFSFQQIFYGAPGTGKSNAVKEKTVEAEINDRVFRTTFHPDSDYSTFVGCYKPTKVKSKRLQRMNLSLEDLAKELGCYYSNEKLGKIGGIQKFCFDYYPYIDGEYMSVNVTKLLELAGVPKDYNVEINKYIKFCHLLPKQELDKIMYEFVPQAFTNAYVKAWNTDEDVYLIVEEINRGNCAQIFGDLFQLLDRKNGVSEYPVEADTDLQNYLWEALADSKRADIPEDVKSGKKLMLPSNLYIWATMNTSDQSLFPIDSAFKRRWDWEYRPIGYKNTQWEIEIGAKKYWWVDFQKEINQRIFDVDNSEDKQLGDYFVNADQTNNIISANTFLNKILFYLWNDVCKDDPDQIFRWIDEKQEKSIRFSDFFDSDRDKKLQGFMSFLKVKAIGESDNKEEPATANISEGEDEDVNA